jgi:hypothetical protein
MCALRCSPCMHIFINGLFDYLFYTTYHRKSSYDIIRQDFDNFFISFNICRYSMCKAMLGIRDILVRIRTSDQRIRICMAPNPDPTPDPTHDTASIRPLSPAMIWTLLYHWSFSWACIQRRGSILAWIGTLSVYGADTIAEVKLLISPFLR